jgi:hypothetical protein
MSKDTSDKAVQWICCTSVDDAKTSIKTATPEVLRGCLEYLASRKPPKTTLTKLIEARLRKLEGPKITVTFEDHGQDFLEWDIQGGKVVGCRPFQAFAWCGDTVLSESFEVGGKITIKTRMEEREITIRYPLVKVVRHK